jgi:CDGSH-type Zn-finger protein/uncharacterized Fe-S cluster protein YjdI
MSDKLQRYDGEKVDVVWDGKLCIHVGECGRARGELFVGGRKPWCQPDLTDVADVGEVVERCPTGALYTLRKDGGSPEAAAVQNTVMVANNGPLYLRGELSIDGSNDDMPGVKMRAALCRCGHSKNKPFCDNAHEDAKFCDRGSVGTKGDGIDSQGGPLTVKRAKNGPLLLGGNFSIMAASGRVAWRGKKAALCRCGESKNKPFCDGAHAKAGFEAD